MTDWTKPQHFTLESLFLPGRKHWRVRKGGFGFWEVYGPHMIWPEAHFRTMPEAVEYADRRAREKTIVLPRPRTREWDGIAFDFSEFAGLDYQPCMDDIALYERGKTFGMDCLIPRQHWRPLGLALLALAEMKDSNGR